jgi:hypothetical protein
MIGGRALQFNAIQLQFAPPDRDGRNQTPDAIAALSITP